MYRRRVAEVVGRYTPEMFLVEDYDYWLRISAVFGLVPLHQTLVNYRYHPDTLTSRTSKDKVRHLTDIALARHLHRLRWVSAPMKADTYWMLARKSKKRHEHVRMLRCYAWAWRFGPRMVAFRARRDLRRSLSGHLG